MTKSTRFPGVLLCPAASMAALFSCVPAVADTRQEVDVQIVLAADVSGSMGRSLTSAQRKGFAAAFREPILLNAVLSGPHGRIAVTYFEWSDAETQNIVIPWRLVDDATDMADIADRLVATEIPAPKGSTSVSGALLFANQLIAGNDFRSRRKVIDVSGDGPNNAGPPAVTVTELIRAAGMTVNGLVMHGMDEEEAGPYWFLFQREMEDTVEFFRNNVRQGPGGFVMEVEDEADFANAILRKLVLEIAWLDR